MKDTYTIKVSDLNWSVILNRVLRNAVPLESREKAVEAQIHQDGSITYLVSREFVPAEVLAKTFGVTVDAVRKSPRIVLKPITGDAAWPAPTVNYVGEA